MILVRYNFLLGHTHCTWVPCDLVNINNRVFYRRVGDGNRGDTECNLTRTVVRWSGLRFRRPLVGIRTTHDKWDVCTGPRENTDKRRKQGGDEDHSCGLVTETPDPLRFGRQGLTMTVRPVVTRGFTEKTNGTENIQRVEDTSSRI